MMPDKETVHYAYRSRDRHGKFLVFEPDSRSESSAAILYVHEDSPYANFDTLEIVVTRPANSKQRLKPDRSRQEWLQEKRAGRWW